MYQIVLCTCPNLNCAKEIANMLVDNKLAACVSIIPEVISVYKWQNETSCETEVQLIIKTTMDKFNTIVDNIKQLHPYETPEIIAVNIQQGDKTYLNWITAAIK